MADALRVTGLGMGLVFVAMALVLIAIWWTQHQTARLATTRRQ